MAQWIRPRILNSEVPDSNLLAAAVVPLGKALNLIDQFLERTESRLSLGYLLYKQLAFLVTMQVKCIQQYNN